MVMTMFRYVTKCIGICATTLLFSGNVFASSYQVNATVPFATPSAPSLIDAVLNNSSTTNATKTVTGTCTPLYPYAVVSLWRGGVLIGSSLCTDAGFFSIDISLIAGRNDITPKTSNIDTIFGPDGVTTAINLTATPKLNPAKPEAQSPALSVTTPQPIVQASETNTVSIDIRIDGGSSPFEVTIIWGDGTTEVKKVESIGTYTFSHSYQKSQNYIIKAVVKDVLGVVSELTVPVVAKGALPSATPTPYQQENIQSSEKSSTRNCYWCIVPIIILVGLLSYWLGIRRERRRWQHNIKATKNRKNHS